jgi:hypothetical protein
MGFVVDKVAVGQDFLRVLRFSPLIFIPLVLHENEKQKKKPHHIHHKVCTIRFPGCDASVACAVVPIRKSNTTILFVTADENSEKPWAEFPQHS